MAKKQFKDLTPRQKQQVIEHAIRLEVRKQLKESRVRSEIDKSIQTMKKDLERLEWKLNSGITAQEYSIFIEVLGYQVKNLEMFKNATDEM